MFGVFYTECTVYSMSKLHNCVVNQAYRGHAERNVDITTPVFSIVVPSLTNYYHVMVEVLPKVNALPLLSVLCHGRSVAQGKCTAAAQYALSWSKCCPR
jgi:hypothetical protein